MCNRLNPLTCIMHAKAAPLKRLQDNSETASIAGKSMARHLLQQARSNSGDMFWSLAGIDRVGLPLAVRQGGMYQAASDRKLTQAEHVEMNERQAEPGIRALHGSLFDPDPGFAA